MPFRRASRTILASNFFIKGWKMNSKSLGIDLQKLQELKRSYLLTLDTGRAESFLSQRECNERSLSDFIKWLQSADKPFDASATRTFKIVSFDKNADPVSRATLSVRRVVQGDSDEHLPGVETDKDGGASLTLPHGRYRFSIDTLHDLGEIQLDVDDNLSAVTELYCY